MSSRGKGGTTEAGAYRNHDPPSTTVDLHGLLGNYADGANIAGFPQVADAMLALGVV